MWKLTETSIVDEEGKAYKTYGIRCGDTVINDFSTDRERTERFVEKLNRFDASEIHALELAENFLGEL